MFLIKSYVPMEDPVLFAVSKSTFVIWEYNLLWLIFSDFIDCIPGILRAFNTLPNIRGSAGISLKEIAYVFNILI